MHCFSTALPGRDRTPEWPELEPERVNFGEPVGVQEVVRLGHPEPLTIPRFTNAASVVNKGGVAPSEQLHISWVAARLRDDGVDDGALTAVFRAAELGVERRERIGTALRIDVELDGEGVRFAGSSTIRMTHATGVSAAAGVLLMLEKPFDAPGVYAPECLDPAAVFGKLRLVSAGGGGVTGMRLRSGEPVEPLRIRDLLAARVQ
jgi:saccharopine dehydrogenase (NAD+, L-lysine-forming)